MNGASIAITVLSVVLIVVLLAVIVVSIVYFVETRRRLPVPIREDIQTCMDTLGPQMVTYYDVVKSYMKALYQNKQLPNFDALRQVTQTISAPNEVKQILFNQYKVLQTWQASKGIKTEDVVTANEEWLYELESYATSHNSFYPANFWRGMEDKLTAAWFQWIDALMTTGQDVPVYSANLNAAAQQLGRFLCPG